MTHDTQSAQITPTQDEHDSKKKDENYFPSQLLPIINKFMAIHTLGHMIYGHLLLILLSQRVLTKPNKEYGKTGLNVTMTLRVLKYHKSTTGLIYEIVKPSSPPINPL